MQQIKVLKKLQETTKYSVNSNILLNTFSNIIKEFKLAKVNAVLNKAKSKGVEGKDIFKTLFTMVFIDVKNVNQLMSSGFSIDLNHKKDVFYAFMKNEWVDWRKILTLFSAQFIKITKEKGDKDEPSTPQCIIVDDTLLEKSGNKIEFIGKVFDHCTHTYQLGIKLLTICFWDGKSLIPADFSIHNEPGKKGNRGLRAKDLKAQFSKKRVLNSPGHQREQELSICKIQMAITMIKRAIKNGLTPTYALADSWFMSEKFIRQVQDIKIKYAKKLHAIGLMKTHRFVVIGAKTIKANQVGEYKRKDIANCTVFKCQYISSLITYKGIEMKAFWVKMKGQENWKMLVTTDTSLTFIKAMKYYQIRWTIEVFFKECKQNMDINNCQSTDFDAYIAGITLSFINYTLLALRKRFDDYETFGELFRAFKDELLEKNLAEKIWYCIVEIYTKIFADLGVDFEIFIENLIKNQDAIENLIKLDFQFLFSGRKQVA